MSETHYCECTQCDNQGAKTDACACPALILQEQVRQLAAEIKASKADAYRARWGEDPPSTESKP